METTTYEITCRCDPPKVIFTVEVPAGTPKPDRVRLGDPRCEACKTLVTEDALAL